MAMPASPGSPRDTRPSVAASAMSTPDIILHVIEETDLPALLNLRAASRAIWATVANYEASIATALARRSYPGLSIELSDDQGVTSFRDFRYWSRRDVAHSLTALSLMPRNLPGGLQEGEFDEVQRSVENGWMIAWRFYDICRKVEDRVPQKMPRLKRMLSLGSGEDTVLQKAEMDLSDAWLELARTLTVEESVDFELMQLYRDGRFLARGAWSLWSSAPVKYPQRGETWLKSRLLRHRPSLVVDLWASTSAVRHEAIQLLETEVSVRSEKRILMEEATFRQLQEDLHALHPRIRQHCIDVYNDDSFRRI